MRGRAYRLTSTWRLDAPLERCWDALADPAFSWPRWWPGVTAREVRPPDEPRDPHPGAPAGDAFRAGRGLVGTAARVEFRSPLRYRLLVDLEVEDARPPTAVRVRAAGDLVGHAEARLTRPEPGRTRVDVLWHVTPTRRWMVVSGAVLAPAYAAAHAAMMRSGERGLARYLAGG